MLFLEKAVRTNTKNRSIYSYFLLKKHYKVVKIYVIVDNIKTNILGGNNMANNLQNVARISGILVSKKVDTGLNRAGEFMSIEMSVRAGKDEHTIRLYSNKMKADGTENKIYKGLKTIADNYKTIEEVGEELAERVNITGELSVNRYVGKDGQLKEYRQIRSNFYKFTFIMSITEITSNLSILF